MNQQQQQPHLWYDAQGNLWHYDLLGYARILVYRDFKVARDVQIANNVMRGYREAVEFTPVQQLNQQYPQPSQGPPPMYYQQPYQNYWQQQQQQYGGYQDFKQEESSMGTGYQTPYSRSANLENQFQGQENRQRAPQPPQQHRNNQLAQQRQPFQPSRSQGRGGVQKNRGRGGKGGGSEQTRSRRFGVTGLRRVPRSEAICEGCREQVHHLTDCNRTVDQYGYIRGCMRCATLGHLWMDCPQPQNKDNDEWFFNVFKRHNKAPAWIGKDVRTVPGFLKNHQRPYTPAYAKEQLERGYFQSFASGNPTADQLERDPAWDDEELLKARYPSGSIVHPLEEERTGVVTYQDSKRDGHSSHKAILAGDLARTADDEYNMDWDADQYTQFNYQQTEQGSPDNEDAPTTGHTSSGRGQEPQIAPSTNEEIRRNQDRHDPNAARWRQ